MKIDEVFAKKTYRIRAPEQIEKLKRFRKQSDSKPEKAQATQEIKKLRQKHLKSTPGLKLVKEIVAKWKQMTKDNGDLYRNSGKIQAPRRGGWGITSWGIVKLNKVPATEEYLTTALDMLLEYGYENPETLNLGNDSYWYTFHDNDSNALASIQGNPISDRDFYTDEKIQKQAYELLVTVTDRFDNNPDLLWK